MIVHRIILTDLKLDSQVTANTALVIIKKENIAKLNKPNPNASKADKEALSGATKEGEGRIDSIQVDAFGHSWKLLCPILQSKWQDIIKEEYKETVQRNYLR